MQQRWRCATGSRTLRIELAAATGQVVPRPAEVGAEAPITTAASDARVQELGAALTDGVPDDPTARSDEQQARWLLAQLLAWHRREDKVAYWEFFRRLGLDDADLTADKGALGPLEVIGPVGDPWKPTPKSKLRQTWRYRFVPQDYDIGPRSRLYDPKLHREHPGETWKTWRSGAGCTRSTTRARRSTSLAA